MSSVQGQRQSAPVPTARKRERRPVELRGEIMAPGGFKAQALVLDLSYEGCKIETPLALAPGQAVRLTVRNGAIDSEVRWARDGEAGLVFNTEQTSERTHVERASERRPVDADIVIRRVGKAKYRVTVRDLSTTGCKVDLIDRPRLGEQMMVKFEGLEVLESEVCWVEGFVAGLRFTRAIHPAVFDLLHARLSG